MAGIYSTRFFVAGGAGVVTSYSVPAGHTAVVRSVTAACAAAPGGYAWLYTGGRPVQRLLLPDGGAGQNLELRQVYRAGDLITVYTSASELWVAVSGYLFTQVGGAAVVQGEVTRELAVDASPLPALSA